MNGNSNNNGNLTKSKERIQKHGEVFTPDWVVNDMLALLPEEVWKTEKTFLEPACGEGAFLVEIFKRKLENIETETQEEWEWQAAIATSSIYGIELLEDNTEQCVMNLIRVFTKIYDKKFPNTQDEELIKTIQFLISRNIIQGNALTYRKCQLSCGNECKTCEPIIFSEWTPQKISTGSITEYKFKRKDFIYEGIINADKMRISDQDCLFTEELSKEEYGLKKEYKSINYKQIRYVQD